MLFLPVLGSRSCVFVENANWLLLAFLFRWLVEFIKTVNYTVLLRMIETRVRDKQALRLSCWKFHLETQNFASDIVICIHFLRHCPLRDAKFCVSTRDRQRSGGLLFLPDKRKSLSRTCVIEVWTYRRALVANMQLKTVWRRTDLTHLPNDSAIRVISACKTAYIALRNDLFCNAKRPIPQCAECQNVAGEGGRRRFLS